MYDYVKVNEDSTYQNIIHTVIKSRGWLKLPPPSRPNIFIQEWPKTTQVIEMNLIPSKQAKCPPFFGTFVSNHLAVLL